MKMLVTFVMDAEHEDQIKIPPGVVHTAFKVWDEELRDVEHLRLHGLETALKISEYYRKKDEAQKSE